MSDSPRQQRFDELYLATRTDILGFLVRRLPQPADAADALAEVYLAAWRRLDDVPAGAGARLWLFGVERNVLANHQRGARRRDRLGEELATALARATDAAPADADVESRDRIRAVSLELNRLPDRDREVLTLHAWEQLSPTEIAELTGATPAAVRVRLHRARQQLRSALARAEGPASANAST